MDPITFIVEVCPDGGWTARALGTSIHTQAATLDQLRSQIRDAVHCHFDEGEGPTQIRLHLVHDEVIAA
jgi:hypothetical protein